MEANDLPDRRPYVGEGVDGASRSAQIDREEADALPTRWPARSDQRPRTVGKPRRRPP